MATHVYLSGPLRGFPGDNVEINVRLAMKVANELLTEGFVPFIPHLLWHMDVYYPRDEADWLNHYSLPWLERSDCVLRFGGPSKVCDSELRLAASLGKPMFMAIPQIIVWRESSRVAQ